METQWHEVRLDHDEGDTGFAKAAPSLLEAIRLIEHTQIFREACALSDRIAQHAALPESTMTRVEKAAVLEALAARRAAMEPFLRVIHSTFASLPPPSTGTTPVAVVQRADGLVIPAALMTEAGDGNASLLKIEHPCANYGLFCSIFDRLSALVASGTWFTAVEPRLKILQSRYALHRTFNGEREDGMDAVAHASPLGGPDLRRAAKIDVRRLETCVSASTVVRFLADLLETEPEFPVVQSQIPATRPHKENGQDAEDTEESSVTLEDALENFYGRDLNASQALSHECTTAARRHQLRAALSVESLCMRPLDGATEDGLSWLHAHRGAAAVDEASPVCAPASAVGLTPAPFSLPADVRPHSDRQEQAADVLRHVLCVDGSGNNGELLRRLVVPAMRKSFAWGSDMNRLELELTLTGRDPEELPRLAEWCAASGLLGVTTRRGEPAVQFALHITQRAYNSEQQRDSQRAPGGLSVPTAESSGGTRRPFPSSENVPTTAVLGFRGMLDNIFRPLWSAVLASPAAETDDQHHTKVAAVRALVQRVTCISVSLDNVSDAVVQAMPVSAALPSDAYPTTGPPPPDALFLFHIWRQVQLLNAFACSQRTAAAATGHRSFFHELFVGGPVRLRLYCVGRTQRTSVNESLLGLLLCDHVVNPAHALDWGPMTYLYYLTQRHVQLTPTRNRFCTPVVRQSLTGALAYAIHVGLHASVTTVDPLLFSTGNHALLEELDSATRFFGLAPTDAAELCLRGVEAATAYAPLTRRQVLGGAWPRATSSENVFDNTQVPSLRIHFRDTCLRHELDLLCRRAVPRRDPGTAPGTPARSPSPASKERARPAPVTAATWLSAASTFLSLRQTSATAASLWGFDEVTTARARLFQWLGLTTIEREQLGGTSIVAQTASPSLPLDAGAEKNFWFPRIVVTGPSASAAGGDARAAAKSLVQIVNRRSFYQQCVVKSDGVKKARRVPRGPLHTTRGTKKTGLSAKAVATYLPPAQAAMKTTRVAQSSSPACTQSGHDDTPHKPRLLMTDGILRLSHMADFMRALPSWDVFQSDVRALRTAASHPTIQRLAQKRLGMLENKYLLHVALTNDDQVGFSYASPDAMSGREPSSAEGSPLVRVTPGRLQKNDVYNCVKVDVHVHMASGVTAPTLLRFMKRKLHAHGDDIVGLSPTTKAPLTLRDVFAEAMADPVDAPRTDASRHGNNKNSNAKDFQSKTTQEVAVREEGARRTAYVRLENLTIANLQVHAGKTTFNRFDEFNSRFSPMGVSSLRTLFLKTDNFMGGRYFAELIHHTLDKQEAEGGVFSEHRLSIYGRSRDEWDRLAKWFVQHGMSHATNRWIIQVPRLYHIYRRTGQVKHFGEMLENIFAPLWEASLEPEKHPFVNAFMAHVSGFDSVDNESDREPDQRIHSRPAEWTSEENPPFAYYMYYMWANIATLNAFRAARGLATFDFRPHAGESGDPDHMADVFFLADGIGHGIQLRHRPVLEYLYYLTQIPLGVVPLSNNALFCRYTDNPFPHFLYRGLNVALATDGSLMFHHTEQPLIEEYSTAQNVWNLSSADVCEVARRSVLMSGFPREQKEAWLGPLFHLPSMAGNDVAKSHVPMTRIAFRYEVFLEESRYLQRRAETSLFSEAMVSSAVEDLETLSITGLTLPEVLVRRWRGEPVERARPEDAEERSDPVDDRAVDVPRRFRVASSNL